MVGSIVDVGVGVYLFELGFITVRFRHEGLYPNNSRAREGS